MDCPRVNVSTTTMTAPQCLQTNFGCATTTGATSAVSAAPITGGGGGALQGQATRQNGLGVTGSAQAGAQSGSVN